MALAGLFNRLKQGLQKTRQNLTSGLANVLLGKKSLNNELIEEIETHLLLADVGAETTQIIIDNLIDRISRKKLNNSNAVFEALKIELTEILKPVEKPLIISPQKPFVILTVGVNGSGKTTTIGKLAHQLKNKKILLAAGDTFRAAAIEQLQIWGKRNNMPVIAQQTGSDSASVIFDTLQSAQAKQMDVLIADTAGRLHTQTHLMEELKKIVRVIKKLDRSAPQETLLVLDAGIGQNALQQAKQFHRAIGVTGLVMTKLDGTAKGGIIFAIAEQLKLPIRFIGVGEKIEDLQPFCAKDFVDALFEMDNMT